MKQKRLEAIISKVLGDNTKRNDEIIVRCPYCNHRKHKLSINLLNYKWHCWVCNVKGVGLQKLFKKGGGSYQDIQDANLVTGKPTNEKVVVEKQIALPYEFQPIATGNPRDPEFRNAAMYLKRRGLTKIDILRHNIGYCSTGSYKGYIIIPSYDGEGNLNYYVGRSYYKSDFPHKNPTASKNVIGFDMLVDWEEDINICEGAFDAFGIGDNTIPIFGKFMPKKLKAKLIEKRPSRVNVILDRDATEAALDVSQHLLDNNIDAYLVQVPEGSDPGDLGVDKMKQLIDYAEPLNLMKIMEMKFEL